MPFPKHQTMTLISIEARNQLKRLAAHYEQPMHVILAQLIDIAHERITKAPTNWKGLTDER